MHRPRPPLHSDDAGGGVRTVPICLARVCVPNGVHLCALPPIGCCPYLPCRQLVVVRICPAANRLLSVPALPPIGCCLYLPCRRPVVVRTCPARS
eukprot:401534-Prymnesium_polylepis.1